MFCFEMIAPLWEMLCGVYEHYRQVQRIVNGDLVLVIVVLHVDVRHTFIFVEHFLLELIVCERQLLLHLPLGIFEDVIQELAHLLDARFHGGGALEPDHLVKKEIFLVGGLKVTRSE